MLLQTVFWICCNFFERLNSSRMKRRMVISFSCESSRPSGPCMSSFCLSSPRWTLSSRTFVWLIVPLHLGKFTKGAAFLPHSHPTLIFCQILDSKCPSSNPVFQEMIPTNGLQNTADYDYKYNVESILTIESACPSSSSPSLKPKAWLWVNFLVYHWSLAYLRYFSDIFILHIGNAYWECIWW